MWLIKRNRSAVATACVIVAKNPLPYRSILQININRGLDSNETRTTKANSLVKPTDRMSGKKKLFKQPTKFLKQSLNYRFWLLKLFTILNQTVQLTVIEPDPQTGLTTVNSYRGAVRKIMLYQPPLITFASGTLHIPIRLPWVNWRWTVFHLKNFFRILQRLFSNRLNFTGVKPDPVTLMALVQLNIFESDGR